MEPMLLVQDRREPLRLVARAERPWHRILARLLAGSLDRRLAAGEAPEAGVLLASRAEHLVTPSHRRTLARLLERHLDATGRRPTRARRGPLRVDGEAVSTATPLVREAASLLGGARPVPARGVALVSLLLADGAGPLFARTGGDSLGAALDRVVEHLDPLGRVAPAA